MTYTAAPSTSAPASANRAASPISNPNTRRIARSSQPPRARRVFGAGLSASPLLRRPLTRFSPLLDRSGASFDQEIAQNRGDLETGRDRPACCARRVRRACFAIKAIREAKQ
jgi:hypothetical protein